MKQAHSLCIYNAISNYCLCNLCHSTISFVTQLAFPEKLYVSVQVCQALTYLHTSEPPLVHLDVKPANILVSVSIYTVAIQVDILYIPAQYIHFKLITLNACRWIP